MKQAPRTLCLLAAVTTACAVTAAAHLRTAQKPPTRAQSTGQKAKGPRATRDARDAKARQLAVAALLEAVETARAVEQAGDRVGLQAAAADALWPLDEAAARSLLRRAWELTTDPNALASFRPEEEGARDDEVADHQNQVALAEARELILMARGRVITCAAKHDPQLAESFLRELLLGLLKEGEGEDEAFTPARNGVRRWPSPLNLWRLHTANLLLNEGAFEAAAAFAAPAVADGPNLSLLRTIMRLHAFAPREAEALYLSLLAVTRADPAADAGDILLLSTPAVTPEVFVIVTPDGSTGMVPAGRYQNDPPGAAPLSTRARRAFFGTAAAVLLRAVPAGAAGEALITFFAVGRLLPFFERESPQHVAALRARQSGLAQEISEARRASVSAQMQVEKLTPRNPPDPLQAQLSALERASTDAKRDAARFHAASAAALRQLWERARQFAGEIGDARTRRAAFLLIAAAQVRNVGEGFRDEDEADDFERAAAFARTADVPAAMRACGLAQAAELAARKGRKKRAGELFDEAMTAAAGVERGTAVQVALLTLLTDAALRTDAARAWELLAQLAAAVNELEGRPESEGAAGDCPGVPVETADDGYCVELAARVPETEEVFASLARLDLERALAEARTLKGPYTRASALIYAARAAVPPAARRRAQAR